VHTPTVHAQPRRRLAATLLDRPALLLLAGIVAAVCAFQLYQTPGNPPGFHRDEASLAYNAWTISRDFRDQDGGFAPLYIVSYHDYKSPLFVYALAGVFRVVHPSAGAARELGAVLVLAAILALGLLAYRRTRSLAIAGVVVALGGLTPWLYELGRTAFEATMEPLVIALLLLAVDRAFRSRQDTLLRGLPPGVALGALTYVYAGGRLLAPLYALALLVFAGRGRRRRLAGAWGAFALTLAPLALYWHDHPGALTARYRSTTFVHDGMSRLEIVRTGVWNYLRDVSPWHWVVSGDPKPYIHSWGAGQLHGAVVVLAAAGAVVVLARRRDRFWLFVIAMLLLSPIPAALTGDRHHALRLLPLPVLALVLAIPGLQLVVELVRRPGAARWATTAAALVLAGGVVVQVVWFERYYDLNGRNRAAFFEADVPPLLARALASTGTIYVDFDDRYAQTQALWYAASHGIDTARVSILPDGGIPPKGSLVFGRVQACDFVCTTVGTAEDYWVARAEGPKPAS
jgi:hypothetical protein